MFDWLKKIFGVSKVNNQTPTNPSSVDYSAVTPIMTPTTTPPVSPSSLDNPADNSDDSTTKSASYNENNEPQV